jgi:hypothetical protein
MKVVLECVNEKLPSITNDIRWIDRVNKTIEALIRQSADRNDIESNFSELTWTADVINTANNLKLDLTHSRAADIFRERFLNCFGIEQIRIHNRRRVKLTHDYVRDS